MQRARHAARPARDAGKRGDARVQGRRERVARDAAACAGGTGGGGAASVAASVPKRRGHRPRGAGRPGYAEHAHVRAQEGGAGMTNETKWTPGPWSIAGETFHGYPIIDAQGDDIAMVK